MLCVILLGMMAIFVARLFYLQIIKHDDYVAMAAAEQIKPLTIPAKRGLIYALDGNTPVPLVINQTVYTLFVDPTTVTDPDKVLDVVRQVAGGNLRPNLEKLIAMKDTRYQILGTKLTRRQAELIKNEKLTGIGFQETTQRVYPEGGLAAQTLGFVNAEGKGQYGIEGALNEQLTGRDGLLKSVTDVSGVPLTIGDKNIHRPAKDGETVVLTIDRNVQAYTEQALAKGLKRSGATDGSVMVMDPQSGKIMAMANIPTYNPENFTQVKDPAAFNNAVISSPYEPGSVMKTFTVATGIDTGTIKPNSTYVNTDRIHAGGITVTNESKGQTGEITMQHALNWSLNTGMVTIAKRLGDGDHITRQARDTMYSYLHDRFRLGQLTGVALTNEVAGIVPKPTIVGAEAQYATMTFGQGMNLTMIQVCSGFSAMINGGRYYAPSIIAGSMSGDDDEFVPVETKLIDEHVIKPSTSNQARKMIVKARQAFYAGNDRKGYMIGGKTGTSQTIVNGKYVDDQTIATYLGFGGDTEPRYVIMVKVSGKDMNLTGARAAMPIFTDISNWLIDYLKLQPKG